MLIHQNPYQGLKPVALPAATAFQGANSSKSLSGIETESNANANANANGANSSKSLSGIETALRIGAIIDNLGC